MANSTLTGDGAVASAHHRRRDLVILAVPQIILFGGMALMLATHPNAVRSGVMSGRAVAVNGLLLAGWLLLSFVILPRLVRNVFARVAILTVGAVVAVVVLVVPTLRDTKVVETFPAVVSPAVVAPAVVTPGVAEHRTPGAADTTTGGAAATPTTAAPAPVRVSTGEISGIGHDATGRASVYRRSDGALVVALEDIDIEPGPDYRVIVVPTPDADRPGDGTELDALRGNQGTQFYVVPGDVGGVGRDWTVLVWCRAFGVPVAAATQHAA